MFANRGAACHSVPTRVLDLFTIPLLAVAAFSDNECPPRYSYCGYSGPAQWPNIAIEDKTNECGGTRQSPISLPAPSPTAGPVIRVDYIAGDATIRNTGHSILVTPAGDTGKITIGENVYKLVEFHFHAPSEHSIPGVAAVAEMHIVHQRVKGGGDENAVIGVMLTKGNEFSALKPVFANIPADACAAPKALLRINFDQLLPKTFGYYTYAGSLTTPPCTQSVTWYVLGAPQTILESDWKKLHALGENARPIQSNRPPLPVTYVRPQ